MEKHSAERRDIEARFIRQQAKKRLQSSINRLQQAMYEMECCLEKLQESNTDFDRAQQMNWAINHLTCNIQPNLRVDLLASSQAELLALDRRTGQHDF